MKVVFADSFWKSLKKLQNHNTWWYKTYELFKYDIPNFLRNLRLFRKELWRFRSFDSVYSALFFKRGLELNGEYLLHGNEIDEIRLKKVAMITRAVELLGHYTEDSYIDLAEKELGFEVNSDYLFREEEEEEPADVSEANKKIFALARKIEVEEWEEMWDLVKGRRPVEIKNKEEFDDYYAQDGSGIRGWWD